MTTDNLFNGISGQLNQVRLRCPELRFGQLIATIGMLAEDETGHSLWDVEDADFAAALQRFARDLALRGSDRAELASVPDRAGITSSPQSTPPSQQPRQAS
jgi:hypothetical protein